MRTNSTAEPAPQILTHGSILFILMDQFFLFFGHVGLSAVQEELVIFMHGEGAAVDQ